MKKKQGQGAVAGTLPPLVGFSEDIISLFRAAFLTESEMLVITLHFHDGRTLEEIGHLVGLSKEKARQRVSWALRKLRAPRAIENTELHDWLCKSNERIAVK